MRCILTSAGLFQQATLWHACAYVRLCLGTYTVWTCLSAGVLVCKDLHVCVCARARGQRLIQILNHSPRDFLIQALSLNQELAHQFNLAAWPVNPCDRFISTSPCLGLQAAAMAKLSCCGANSDIHACIANPLPTDLSPSL